MLLSIKTAEIAAHLICKYPVLVTGPVGSGKFIAAAQAMEIVGELPLLDIDMKHARQACHRDLSWEDVIAPQARFMTHVNNLLKKYPGRAIIYNNIEYATPEWVAPMLEQMMFSNRRVVLVATEPLDPYYLPMPLFDRCKIVRM